MTQDQFAEAGRLITTAPLHLSNEQLKLLTNVHYALFTYYRARGESIIATDARMKADEFERYLARRGLEVT